MFYEPQGKRFQFLTVKHMALHVLMSGISVKDPVFVAAGGGGLDGNSGLKGECQGMWKLSNQLCSTAVDCSKIKVNCF